MSPKSPDVTWRHVLEANGWVFGNYSDPDVTLKLLWRQKPQDFWEFFSPEKDIVNRFPSVGHINDKANNMRAIKLFFQGIGCNYEEVHPASYSLRNYGDCLAFLEDVDVIQRASSTNETLWYIKNPKGTQGKGIRVLPTSFLLLELGIASDKFGDHNTRQNVCRRLKVERHAEFLQKQIHPPLLIHGSTFHARFYILILSTDPYIVLFRKGFVLRNLYPYQEYAPEHVKPVALDRNNDNQGGEGPEVKPKEGPMTLPLESYITHTTFQERHANYSYTDHFWLFNKVEEYFGSEKMGVLLDSLQRLAMTMTDVIEPGNTKQEGLYFFLAVDSVVKNDMSVRLLEVNTVPYIGVESDMWQGRQREDFKIANEVLHLGYKYWGLKEREGLVLSEDWEMLRDGKKRLFPLYSCHAPLYPEL